MKRVIVGIGDCKVSNNPEEELVTYALGSCIAVIVYDKWEKIGGMLHFMLPDSSINPDQAKIKPNMYADHGIPMLFDHLYKLGAKAGRLCIKIVGGGQFHDPNQVFNIGKRNILAARKIIWQMNLMITADLTAGTDSRTVTLNMETGTSIVKVGMNTSEL